MNKAELVEKVANQTGLTKKTSREAVDAIISAITDCLSREEKVTLVGFGTFQVMERKARRGVNPQKERLFIGYHPTIISQKNENYLTNAYFTIQNSKF